MNRRERRQAARLQERWVREVARHPGVDDDTFRVLNYLAQYADENGDVTVTNEDGTTNTYRLAFPKGER